MALYSATLVTHLGTVPFWTSALVTYSILDHSFALADAKYQENLEMTLSQKLAAYFGATGLVGAIWRLGHECSSSHSLDHHHRLGTWYLAVGYCASLFWG